MEPLAELLRQQGAEWGVPLGDGIHAVSLYADDIMIFLKDFGCLPIALMNTLATFANLSGLKVHWSKSCKYLFRHTQPYRQLQCGDIGIPWRPVTFRYLGVRIYHSQEDLLEGNIGRAMTALH